jgi:hypothetical protein
VDGIPWALQKAKVTQKLELENSKLEERKQLVSRHLRLVLKGAANRLVVGFASQ